MILQSIGFIVHQMGWLDITAVLRTVVSGVPNE